MKIAILNTFYYPQEPGGAERSVRILAESLVEQGHSVTVVCLGTQRENSANNGVIVERLPIANSYLPTDANKHSSFARLQWHARDTFNFAAGRQLQELLGSIKPDVLHTNNLSGFSVAAWRSAQTLGIPVVHTTRDFYLLCPQTTMQKGDRTCDRPCATCLPFAIPKRFASSRIAHVVGISNYILNKHKANHAFDQVPASVIYNSFSAVNVDYAPLGSVVRLGFIGRLAPAKGVELLIEATRQLIHEGLAVQVRIAGTGKSDYVNALNQLAAGLPIEFVGHAEPRDFFPSIDMTVVPSTWAEPLGRVVIESMAFGKPVVATNVGGMPELMSPATGVICPALTSLALASSIRQLAEQLRQSGNSYFLATRAESTKFAPDHIAQKYLTVYASVMKV